MTTSTGWKLDTWQGKALAALAEAGYPHVGIVQDLEGSLVKGRWLLTGRCPEDFPPGEVAYRAMVLADSPDLSCRACYLHNASLGPRILGDLLVGAVTCLDPGSGSEDCGRERP